VAFKPIEILINAKDNASSVFSSLQAKVMAVGAAIATYFGINAFAGVVGGAADLEQAMSRVKAATNASAEEMAQLRAAAENAGATTKFSGVEAAGALENLAKAGLSATDAIAALPAVLNLAQAGDLDLATASEFLTKAVMGMGLAFTDAGRVADVLALGANATNTSVTGLAQALSYAAPVASSLGLSLESTVAIIGKFADAGIDASRAGTALNSILSQFSNPASQFRNELAAAGITTGNFEQALHELAAAGPRGSKAIIAVGQEAGPALRALLNQGMGALDELTVKLRNAEGAAAAAAKVLNDNLNGSLASLENAWKYVKNTLATPVLPVLKDGVDQLAAAFRGAVADGTVQRFGEAIATAFQNGIKFVREFVASVDLNAVLVRLQEFAATAQQTFTKVGEYATNAGNTVQLAYGVMSAGTNAVLTAIYGVGSVFSEVASVVMSGIAKLREGLASITFGSLSESFKLAAEDARNMAQGFGEAAQAMRDKAGQSLQAVAEGAQTARDGFSGLAGATQETAAATVVSTGAMAAMAKELTNGAEAAAKAGAAYQKKVNDEQAAKQAADAHREAIAQLRAEYDSLISSGSLTEAGKKLEEINEKLRQTPKAAEEAAEKLEGAFRTLGMTTTKDLEDAATKTAAAWDTLTASGVKSASVLREAFTAYANAAMQAAERQGSAAVEMTRRLLEAKAAAAGLGLEADQGGKVIVRSMKDAKKSVDDVGDSAGRAGRGFRGMGQSAKEAAEQVKRLKDIHDRQRLGGDPEKSDLQNLNDRYSLDGKQSDKDLADMRKNTSGNVTVSQDYVNAEIARLWGEAFVGDKDAEALFHAKAKLAAYKNNYGNVVRSQESLNEQHGVQQLVERLEQKLRERQADLGRKPAAKPADERDDPPARPRGGGGGGGSGVSAGTTQVTINFEGRPRTVNTDAAGAASLQEFLRELAAGRSTARR